MRSRRRERTPPVPTTAEERAYLERAIDADIDARANEVALHLGVPFEHVRDLYRADLEAYATIVGGELPIERRFYPAGSLPPLPEEPQQAANEAAWAALRRDMPARGIPRDVVDAVLDDFARNAVANRRQRRRSRWSTGFAIAVTVIVVGIILLPDADPGAASDPDPDGAWAADVLAALEPFAATTDGPARVPCADPARTEGRRVTVSASLSDDTEDEELAAALDEVGLPADGGGRFTHFIEDENDSDAGQVVVIDRDPSGAPIEVRVYSRCGAT